MPSPKHFLWILANSYGWIFGWRFLAPIHRALLIMNLHALGYDNTLGMRITGEEDFIRRVLSAANIRTAFDVGANVGHYSRMLEHHLSCEVYAFEPASASFRKLEECAKDNSSIHPVRAAVGNVSGTLPLYARGAFSEKATLDSRVDPIAKVTEEVPVVRLDEFVLEKGLTVDFIKIDVEGLEREVLQGLGDIRPRFIQFEFNKHHLYRTCTVYELTELLPGYDFFRLLPHGMVRIDPRRFADNIFMFSNVVGVRNV